MSIKQTIGVLFCISFLVCISCDNQKRFHLKGTVNDAADEMLYLEHIGLSSVEVVDSVKLDTSGKFSFEQNRPEDTDFYRLKLNNKAINIAVDSTEQIMVTAHSKDFATSYSVEGSQNCTLIKELTLLQLKTNRQYSDLKKERQSLTTEEYREKLLQLLANHKEQATPYIMQSPGTSVAYFALFQQIDGLLIYDPYDAKDNRIYSAVATNWDAQHEGSQRAKHLHALTLQALKELRSNRVNLFDNIQVKDVLSFFEIELPDVNGNTVKLSDVVKGEKVILIDFTAYQTRYSPAHNMDLGELYEKYQSKGFEIFQVSLDSDLNFWQNAAVNAPWICVRDAESIYSRTAAIYNVKDLPTSFILNRKGEIVKRIETENIEEELKKVL